MKHKIPLALITLAGTSYCLCMQQERPTNNLKKTLKNLFQGQELLRKRGRVIQEGLQELRAIKEKRTLNITERDHKKFLLKELSKWKTDCDNWQRKANRIARLVKPATTSKPLEDNKL